MFCNKCGAQNADNATFCCACGAAFGGQQSQPQQYAQQQYQAQPQQYAQDQYGQYAQYDQYGQPIAYAPVKTKNRSAIIAALIVGIVAIAGFAVILIFMFGGATGANSPREVVESYIDAMVDGDVDDMIALFPEDSFAKMAESQGMSESDLKSQMQAAVSMISGMISEDNFTIGSVNDVSSYELSEIMSNYASIGYSVSDVKEVELTMSIMGSTQDEDIVVIKIDGKWYMDFESAL